MDKTWESLMVKVYRFLGTTLLAVGIILGCVFGSRVGKAYVEARLLDTSKYLIILSTPNFELPSDMPPPTPRAQPTGTAVPTPVPPIHLTIAVIGLNTAIVPVYPISQTSWTGEEQLIWDTAANAVGHYFNSGYPLQNTNIVLSGHNNIEGSVFRDLSTVSIGDEVIISTTERDFTYRVQEKVIIPYLGNETAAEVQLDDFTAPTPTEQVTMISCWPYASSTHRIVVIAVPVCCE